MNNAEQTPSSSQWSSKDGQRVVLFDLDDTLIDSGRAREERWRAALEKLEGATLGNDLETLLAAYKALYGFHEDITGKTGPRGHVFEDIRQEWNTRISYALLIAWCQQSTFPRQNQTKEETHKEALERLKADGHWPSLLARAEEISDPWSVNYSISIDRARQTFWQGDWNSYVYDGVTESLRELKQRGIGYCVATEGHLPTQWRKICVVGLDTLIAPEQLLATSQAARPEQKMRALNDLIAWYGGRAAANQEAAQVLRPDGGSDSDGIIETKASELQLDAKAAELIAGGLVRIKRLFDRMAKKLYRLHEDALTPAEPGPDGLQVQPEFYIRVLYAINQAPQEPRDRLMKWDLSWNEKHPIRLAMVGDNPKNDVAPVLLLAHKLDRKIMSVRVRQGKRREEEVVIPVEGLKKLPADCKTIRHAFTDYLLNDEEWRERTDVLRRPMAPFGSAIQPPDPQDTLALQRNILELLAGVAGARSAHAPDPLIVETAKKFVDEVFEIILFDIRDSQAKDLVIERALVICRDERDAALILKISGLPQTAVEFVLFLVESSGNDQDKFTKYLEVLADLLNLRFGAWASSMVRTLFDRKRVIGKIREILTLRELYIRTLEPIIKTSKLPRGFPIAEANLLYSYLKG